MTRRLLILAAVSLTACGTDVSGPSRSLLSCAFDDARALDVGGVAQVRGAGNQGLCLDGPTGGAGYLYVPFFARAAPGADEPSVSLSLAVTGAGFGEPGAVEEALVGPTRLRLDDGAPAAVRGPDKLPLDRSFDAQLRRREIRELEPLIHAEAPAPAVPEDGTVVPAEVPAVGELVEYNVAVSCTAQDLRVGRVEYVSDHAIVVADTSNPPAGLGPADYQFFAVTFDTLVYPVDTENFGVPTDIDHNGRAIMFFTRAVNERTAHGAAAVTAGFFWTGDLFPDTATARLEACPGGNDAEMFYMLAADPLGLVGAPFGVDYIRDIGVGVIGHEYQHLINASRRLYVALASTFEVPWLNEGLSHVAEELLFYHAAGLEPGQNLDVDAIRAQPGAVAAFNRYASYDLGNFGGYLARPDTVSLMGVDNLVTRGATWSFLRYAADRSGRGDAAFFFDLVNSTVSGLDNLDEVIGEPALGWMQDWTVTAYADDVVAGLAPRYTQPSWNFHSIFRETLGHYPLQLTPLVTGETQTLKLLPGGAGFLVFGVDPGDDGVVHVEANGTTPPTSLRGSLLRYR